MTPIPFNRSPYTGNEAPYVQAALRSDRLSGDGPFSRQCQGWFESALGCRKALLTPSCTHALEMAALLIDIQPGDEVIMPSYTFVSTANAFVLRGATIVFVDVRPDTMNLDERLIEAAITPRTRAIVAVHYAGVACDMVAIMDIAGRHDLVVVEDAAQGMGAMWQGRPLGTIGHIGAYSFHETKNYTSGGEGGLLIINDERYASRAEIIREKGTNRSQFFRGMVDQYSWVDIGSSYLLSDLQAACLWGQLERFDDIRRDRLRTWTRYQQGLQPLADQRRITLPTVPAHAQHNASLFYLKTDSLDERTRLISHLAGQGIQAVFHYVPLHSSLAGQRFGRLHGSDKVTTAHSDRLLRLPLWFGMSEQEADRVVAAVSDFFVGASK